MPEANTEGRYKRHLLSYVDEAGNRRALDVPRPSYELGNAKHWAGGLTERWQLGGKAGFRLSDSAPDAVTPRARNDAGLVVINARYNLTYRWDALVEARYLSANQAGVSDAGALLTVSRQIGENFQLGLGYNFNAASDDLTDLTTNRSGPFLNLVAKF